MPPGHRTHENISHPFAPACLSLWHLADGWHLPHRGWEGGEDGTRTKTAGVSLKLTPVPGQLSREAQCLALEEGEGGEGRAGWRGGGGVTMFKVQAWGAGQGQSPRQEAARASAGQRHTKAAVSQLSPPGRPCAPLFSAVCPGVLAARVPAMLGQDARTDSSLTAPRASLLPEVKTA